MPLKEPETEIDSMEWAGGEVLVIHGDSEGCWLQAEDSDSFVNLEDCL